MLFWSFLIVGILLVGLGFILDKLDFLDLEIFPTVLGVFLILIFIVMILFVAINNITYKGEAAALEEQYESLMYQYENDIYDNDNDLGKRELMKDIEKWNTNLAKKQKYQNDFWIGIFYPNIYDQFEFIELK